MVSKKSTKNPQAAHQSSPLGLEPPKHDSKHDSKPDLPDGLSLEDALAELEALVERLESGKDELDAAFKLYEHAETIANHAQQKLSAYEDKLRVITQKGETSFQPTLQDEESKKPSEPS